MEFESEESEGAADIDRADIDREAEFSRGLEAYRAHCHFDALDIWTVVHETEQNETTRRFLQALMQVANAMHKVRHSGELRGALHLLERALIKLDELPDVYGGLDLVQFRDVTRECLAEVARLLSIKSVDLAESFIPPLNTIVAGPALEQPRAPIPPGQDPDKLLEDGFAAYRNGHYYDAQELWEESRRPRPEGSARDVLTGLILVATAMHKLHRAKSPAAAAQMLELALDRLRDASDGTFGVSITELVEAAERIHADLEQVESQSPIKIDPNHVLQIRVGS